MPDATKGNDVTTMSTISEPTDKPVGGSCRIPLRVFLMLVCGITVLLAGMFPVAWQPELDEVMLTYASESFRRSAKLSAVATETHFREFTDVAIDAAAAVVKMAPGNFTAANHPLLDDDWDLPVFRYFFEMGFPYNFGVGLPNGTTSIRWGTVRVLATPTVTTVSPIIMGNGGVLAFGPPTVFAGQVTTEGPQGLPTDRSKAILEKQNSNIGALYTARAVMETTAALGDNVTIFTQIQAAQLGSTLSDIAATAANGIPDAVVIVLERSTKYLLATTHTELRDITYTVSSTSREAIEDPDRCRLTAPISNTNQTEIRCAHNALTYWSVLTKVDSATGLTNASGEVEVDGKEYLFSVSGVDVTAAALNIESAPEFVVVTVAPRSSQLKPLRDQVLITVAIVVCVSVAVSVIVMLVIFFSLRQINVVRDNLAALGSMGETPPLRRDVNIAELVEVNDAVVDLDFHLQRIKRFVPSAARAMFENESKNPLSQFGDQNPKTQRVIFWYLHLGSCNVFDDETRREYSDLMNEVIGQIVEFQGEVDHVDGTTVLGLFRAQNTCFMPEDAACRCALQVVDMIEKRLLNGASVGSDAVVCIDAGTASFHSLRADRATTRVLDSTALGFIEAIPALARIYGVRAVITTEISVASTQLSVVTDNLMLKTKDGKNVAVRMYELCVDNSSNRQEQALCRRIFSYMLAGDYKSGVTHAQQCDSVKAQRLGKLCKDMLKLKTETTYQRVERRFGGWTIPGDGSVDENAQQAGNRRSPAASQN